MEPLLKEKRDVVALIPYRRDGGKWEFYLQKRDRSATVHASIFSLFGGGIEKGEGLDDALKREIREELDYTPRMSQYFCRFETSRGIFHVFIEEVDFDFESQVNVKEGEYGKFLSFALIDHSPEVSDIAEMIVRALNEYLRH